MAWKLTYLKKWKFIHMEVQHAQKGMVGTATAFALNTKYCAALTRVNSVKMLFTPHVNSPLNMQVLGNF